LKNDNREQIDLDVVILMAGEGRRLLPLTEDRPKALLYFKDGISIFEHIVRAFAGSNLNVNIIPVIGHGRFKAKEEVDRLYKLAQFQCVTNPFYASAGPLVSLWLGLLESKHARVVILNGDTIIKSELVDNIINWIEKKEKDRLSIGVCTTLTEVFVEDDMKILLNEAKNFSKAGKDIDPGKNVLKSAGVICLKDALSKKILREKLDELLLEERALGKKFYWHNILNEVNGLFKIDLIDVNNDSWHEVDTNGDLSHLF